MKKCTKQEFDGFLKEDAGRGYEWSEENAMWICREDNSAHGSERSCRHNKKTD